MARRLVALTILVSTLTLGMAAAAWWSLRPADENAATLPSLPEGVASGVALDETTTMPLTLIAVDADPRQVGLSIYHPVVEGLASAGAQSRADTEARSLATVMNLARLTDGLYPGIDRVTVMLGTWDGRFEPQTRYTLNQKGFAKLDQAALRQKAGAYGDAEASALDVRWTRWAGEK